LTITGPGSRVEVVSNSLGLAPGVPDNFNPFVAIGYDSGSPGQLSISNGGQLLLTGNALSTPTDTRVTALHIGGRSNTSANHLGSASVSGTGSQILLNGADALINVGRGPGSVGTLDVTSGGHVGSISLVVGAFGNGSVSLDGGSIALSGQRTDSTNVGAGMTIGRGTGGVGVMTLANGSSLSFQNNGTLDIGFSVGGDGFASGGTGTLLVSGGSSITLAGSVGGGASIGRTGSGTLTLSGNSLLDVGSNRSIYVGRDAAGSGALSVFSGSSVNAGYVGVGSTTGGDTGGGALLVVDNSSLTATTLEIGTTGMLSGDEGTINANVLNRGILSPGNSPGRIIINGGFHNLVGGRLVLDVDEVAGEFQVDHLVLTAGSSFGFDDVTVTFNFIGDTDPEAFAASGGFDLDNFIQSSDSNGNVSGLSTVFEPDASWETVFASAQFEAASPTYDVTQLSLTQDGSFGVVAVPVPEPQTVILWLAGLGLLSAVRLLQRRR
ncbi:PEP-CTERM sorting domain-containing protein, partial [Aquabacterium sp.]|uniref:PEP-CTERM sorting domain-containing protein n=1 Tax=Aquabacterium sp. TaxID=1872578 RepID=UPI002C7C7235